MRAAAASFAALLIVSQMAFSEDAAVTPDVRTTVARSLDFIQREGERWIETKKCDSCHLVPFMIWSLNAAADHGFTIDAGKLAEWNDWARDWRSIRGRELAKEDEKAQALLSGSDEVSQLLLGRRADESHIKWSTPDSESLALKQRLLSTQQEDGSWKPGGQLPSQKRPLRETKEVSTFWALLAIASCGEATDSEKASIDIAIAWLGTSTVGESTEWWSARLLWSRFRGTAATAEECRSRLLEQQHEDGGWGWLLAEKSDALGTGLALYALARDGLPREHPAVRRAQDILVNTQVADGSWPVHGTKQNKRERVEPTATYWGTCWAVIGLTQTLDAP